jgi:hypothetical protein
MKKYFPFSVSLKQKYTNPFRNDSKRGCYFAYTKKQKLRFFDNAFPNKGGDCFDVARMSMDKADMKEALIQINEDFQLGLVYSKRDSYITPFRADYIKKNKAEQKRNLSPKQKALIELRNKLKGPQKIQYRVTSRPFERVDHDYWTKRFGIPLSLLVRYDVIPVESYSKKRWNQKGHREVYNYINHKFNPCYVYKFVCNGITSMKIYKPLSVDKSDKWESNISDCNVQGLDQLPERGELLIVASSMKDLLVLVANGYNAVAPQGESIGIPDDIYKDLEKRFKRIVFCFDRDNAGRKWAKHFAVKHKAEFVELPRLKADPEDRYKDFAEYRELFGKYNKLKEFGNMLKQMFHESSIK